MELVFLFAGGTCTILGCRSESQSAARTTRCNGDIYISRHFDSVFSMASAAVGVTAPATIGHAGPKAGSNGLGGAGPAAGEGATPRLPQLAPLSKYKVVFLGDQGTGKTSIIKAFIHGSFDANYQVRGGRCPAAAAHFPSAVFLGQLFCLTTRQSVYQRC